MNQQPISKHTKLLCLLSFLMLLAVDTALTGQPIPFCGIHVKPPSINAGQGASIYDRFGNVYSEEELLRIRSEGKQINCNTPDVFQLNFIGNFAPDDEQTICAVFEYLSGLVAPTSNVQVPIDIIQEPMTYPAPAAASDFYVGQCGLVNSSVLEQIRTGGNALPNGVAAAALHIRLNPTPSTTWFSLADEQNTPINNSQIDLYSVVLHEALHTFGIASLIGLNGNSIVGNNRYSNWDRFLTGGIGGSSLIIPDPSGGGCCNAHVFNNTDFPNMPQPLLGSCNINTQFTSGGVNVAPVNDVNLSPVNNGQMANKLSHLDISCGNANYVMNARISTGEIKRTLTAAELEILCSLGYETTGCAQSCTVIAQDDIIQQTIVLTGPGTQNPLVVPFAELLANDGTSPGVVVELIPNCGLGAGIQVQALANGFEITGLTQGVWTFCYSVSDCNGAVCDQATVTITVQNALVNLDCDPIDCNLVDFGDFEGFVPGNATYHAQIGAPNFEVMGSTIPQINTVDIQNQLGNQVLRWVRVDDANRECPRIPLCEPVLPNCTLTIRFRAASARFGDNITIPSPILGLYGITDEPCNTIIEPLCIPGNFQLCPGVQATCIGQENLPYFPFNTNPVLQNYEIIWVNTSGLTITDFLLYGHFLPGGNPANPNYQYLFDDLTVTSSCSPQITVTPVVLQQCVDGQAIVEYEVCLENPQQGQTVDIQLQAGVPVLPGVNIVAGGGFNGAGEANLSFPDQDGDPNCATLTLTLDIGANVQPGTALTIAMDGASLDACLNLQQQDADVDLTLEVCDPEPLACHCPAGGTNYVVGVNSNSVTLASQSGIPVEIDLTSVCIEVNGRFIWDNDAKLNACYLIMNEGAEIVIPAGGDLGLTDCTLEGCEHMWRGITVEGGGWLRANDNHIYDAQYAIQARANASIIVTDNEFDRNYVGVYVPPGSNNQSQTVNEYFFTGNHFTCTAALKTAFASQDPAPGLYTHAGVVLHNAAGFSIQQNNVMDGISNGVFAYQSAFSVERCTIQNLIANTSLFDLDRYGVYVENCVQAEITNSLFDQVATGVYADNSNLVVRNNDITTFPTAVGSHQNAGVYYVNGTGRKLRIQSNEILASRFGISVSNCLPAAGLRIKFNTIDLHPGSSTTREGINLSSCRTGWVTGNTVLNGTGNNNFTGLYLLYCRSLTIYDNDIEDQYTGGYVFGCSDNYFFQNDLVNDSYSGVLGTTGFNVNNSSDRYCFNLTDGQSSNGLYFEGACASTHLNCNTIEDASTGLSLWADPADPTIGTIIGPQLNTGNMWTGTYGSGLGAFNGTTDINLIPLSRFSMPANQIPTWSTGAGQAGSWFGPITGNGSNCFTCLVPLDPEDDTFPGPGEDPEDGLLNDADIRIAKGEVNGEGIRWISQQRLYERLMRNEGMANTDTDVQAFFSTTASSTLGQLYAFQSGYQMLHERDAYSRYFLSGVQADMLAAFDSLNVAQATGPNGNEAMWLNQLRALKGQLAMLINLYYAHEEALEQTRSEEAAGLASENSLIDTQGNICSENEKKLNSFVLENKLWKLAEQPQSVVDSIKAIADQCPLEGGLAVYAARSIYQFFEVGANWDDTNCLGAAERSLAKSAETALAFTVQPNPADQLLTISSQQVLAQEAEITLTDVQGRTVVEQSLALGQSAMRIQIAHLPPGVYTYRIWSSDKILQTGMVVIVH
ncbi:MAG: NosD domain-containing protein [Saprospiraceae bacterium]